MSFKINNVDIQQALKYGSINLKNKSDSSALDAEILLSFTLKKDRAFLFTYPEKELTKQQWQKYKKLIAQRKKHKPIAYITHHKEFYGLDFYVDKRVLIPRPETENLIEEVINFIKHQPQTTNHQLQTTILDVGTGSGCIAIALAKNLPKAKIYAIDISKKAIAVAKINAKKHKVLSQIKFIKSNLLNRLPKTIKFNVIVVNLPYLSKKEWQNTVLDIKKYEPKLALVGGENGNEIYKKFFLQAKQYLKPNGKIFLELFNFKNTTLKLI